MRRTKIVPNGEPGAYEMERSPLEVGLAISLFTAMLGGFGWMIVNQVQLGREVSGQGGDLRALHTEIALRVAQRDREYAGLIQADKDAADRDDNLAESLASIEQRLVAFRSVSESNQRHALGILEKLPVQKEKRR